MYITQRQCYYLDFRRRLRYESVVAGGIIVEVVSVKLARVPICGDFMTKYCISLYRQSGALRLKCDVSASAIESVWRQIHALSASVGQPGDYFEVSDDNGGIVIRIGVMTNRTAQSRLKAA